MHINDSWRIQRESVLSSHIYHLVWFSNLVGPFVSYIRNHLIESPKSISLHFQLAYCCPFRLIAYNDSLMSGISKSVFGGSDYISKNCYFYLPITEKHFSLCSRASLSSACLSAQPPSPAGELMEQERPHGPGWALFFLKLQSELLQNTGHLEICEESSIQMHASDGACCPAIIISSWLHRKLAIITTTPVRKQRSKVFSDLPEISPLPSVGAKRPKQVSHTETLPTSPLHL